MPSSSERFDLINFHDSPVTAAGRRDAIVWLELRYVHLAAEHPGNASDQPIRVGPCTVAFHGVRSVDARLFDDATREWVVHPAPEMPLDGDIIQARTEGVGAAHRYVFDGMHTSG